MLREVKGRDDEKPGTFYGMSALACIRAVLTVSGIPLRVWYIILACLGIFSFTRLLLRKLPNSEMMDRELTAKRAQTQYPNIPHHQVSSLPRIT